MASVLLDTIILNGLPSKPKFVRVNGIEAKKPEPVSSGDFLNRDLVGKSQVNGRDCTAILSDPPNFRKEIGESVSEELVERFIKIPRELFEDPNWKGLRLKYQRLFLIILEQAAYRPRIYKYNGNSIPIAPGQFCVSFRRLAEIFNQDVKWKDERIDASLVQRAVSVFSQFGFSIHESIHGIMRITITQRELYEHFKKLTDTPSDTKPIQNRYTNEERKERKELEETIDGGFGSSLLNLEEEIKKAPECSDQEKMSHVDVLWAFCIENLICEGKTKCGKPGIKKKDIEVWIKKYEPKEVLQCLKMVKDATIKMTYGGYVTKLLKDKIPQRESNLEEGRKIVEDIVKRNKMNHIELKQDYFIDLVSEEQSYYSLPKETLTNILKRSFERCQERDREVVECNY